MNKNIIQKLKELPKSSGVYIFRNEKDRIIYVGKAVNLKSRVSSYFSGRKDPKTAELVKNITSMGIQETGSEFEALILESDLVKRYKPKYNVRLKDDKGYVYLKLSREDYPRVSIVRQIIDPEADYLGPYIDAYAVRNILKIARKIFPFCSCEKKNDEVCLYFHLNLCPGHSEQYISKKDYGKNIKGLKKLFSGKTDYLEKIFDKEMEKASKMCDFEKAAVFRDRLRYLERIQKSHFISERDLSADKALIELKKELELPKVPVRLECFDISNIMGRSAVGSMAVFTDGIASPKEYRRFQIKTVKGANDFAMMAEVVARRLKSTKDDLPDLIILDGGKGQLSAVLQNTIVPKEVTVVALAKKQEELFRKKDGRFEKILLTENSEAYFLIQRIRDEAHRFAITYHRKVRSKEAFSSTLDDILGVGPKTKKKLISHFGSIKKIKETSNKELSEVVGVRLARRIKEKL